MKNRSVSLPNLIIAGAPKAATTSVFSYLSDHPEVCGSSIKETAFFYKNYKGDPNVDREFYTAYFKHCRSTAKIVVEASPGYLVLCKDVAPRIRTLLPDVRLLFILREPVNRLYSYYNFHIGQLTKDFDLNSSFEDYVEKCTRYASGEIQWKNPGIGVRHLRNLEVGVYGRHLREYYRHFAREQIKILFYEHMKEDLRSFMNRLCDFLGIDVKFYDAYTFDKINVTFTSRIKVFHSLAVAINKKCELLLRHRPHLKRRIVTAYKFLNQKREGYKGIPEATRIKLLDYYEESNKELSQLLNAEECPSWVRGNDEH